MIAMRIYRGVSSHFWQRLPEWYAAGQALQFGLKLLQSGSTFASSHAYDMMASLMSEDAWGYVIVAVAAVRIICLFFNGSLPGFRRYSPTGRMICAFLSASVWFSIGSTFLAGNPSGTAAGTYGLLMFFDIGIAVAIAKEAGAAFRKG